MNGILSNKISAQSLVDALAERIEAAIMSGDLQPGS
jgi:DNA-binding FadR family transcriptional regulator